LESKIGILLFKKGFIVNEKRNPTKKETQGIGR
jgi:hypothetical protein